MLFLFPYVAAFITLQFHLTVAWRNYNARGINVHRTVRLFGSVEGVLVDVTHRLAAACSDRLHKAESAILDGVGVVNNVVNGLFPNVPFTTDLVTFFVGGEVVIWQPAPVPDIYKRDGRLLAKDENMEPAFGTQLPVFWILDDVAQPTCDAKRINRALDLDAADLTCTGSEDEQDEQSKFLVDANTNDTTSVNASPFKTVTPVQIRDPALSSAFKLVDTGPRPKAASIRAPRSQILEFSTAVIVLAVLLVLLLSHGFAVVQDSKPEVPESAIPEYSKDCAVKELPSAQREQDSQPDSYLGFDLDYAWLWVVDPTLVPLPHGPASELDELDYVDISPLAPEAQLPSLTILHNPLKPSLAVQAHVNASDAVTVSVEALPESVGTMVKDENRIAIGISATTDDIPTKRTRRGNRRRRTKTEGSPVEDARAAALDDHSPSAEDSECNTMSPTQPLGPLEVLEDRRYIGTSLTTDDIPTRRTRRNNRRRRTKSDTSAVDGLRPESPIRSLDLVLPDLDVEVPPSTLVTTEPRGPSVILEEFKKVFQDTLATVKTSSTLPTLSHPSPARSTGDEKMSPCFIPESRRADGSLRPQIKIRPGFSSTGIPYRPARPRGGKLFDPDLSDLPSSAPTPASVIARRDRTSSPLAQSTDSPSVSSAHVPIHDIIPSMTSRFHFGGRNGRSTDAPMQPLLQTVLLRQHKNRAKTNQETVLCHRSESSRTDTSRTDDIPIHPVTAVQRPSGSSRSFGAGRGNSASGRQITILQRPANAKPAIITPSSRLPVPKVSSRWNGSRHRHQSRPQASGSSSSRSPKSSDTAAPERRRQTEVRVVRQRAPPK